MDIAAFAFTGTNGLFGRRNAPSAWCNIAMGEMLFFNRLLSAGELNQVGNYMAPRWGTPVWTSIAA